MKKIGWITGKKKLLRLAGLSLMGVLLLSGCGNTGKSAVAAASSTSASETSNEAGKGSKVSQPAENVEFAKSGTLPPWIAVWIPNILYLCIAVYLYRKAPK